MMTATDAIKAALDRWSGLPLKWGLSDCATAMADIYVAQGFPDPMAGFRGRYRTRIGALRMMGPGGLAEHVRELGWQPVDTEDAIDGDLGLLQTDDGPACCIFYRGFWVGRLDGGYAAHPIKAVSSAWRPTCPRQ